MNIKTAILPLVAGESVFAVATYLLRDRTAPQPVSQAAAEPPPQASADVPPLQLPGIDFDFAPAPQEPPENAQAEKPGNQTPTAINSTPDPAPVRTSNAKRKNPVAEKLVNNPSPPASPTPDRASPALSRWKVPPLSPPKGRIYFAKMTSVAINNDGTRVIAQNFPFVDIWDTQKVSNVRLCPEPYADLNGGAIISQDASRIYIWNTDAKKVETYNEKGARISSLPQLGFASLNLQRLGYDFSPRDFALGSRLYDASTPASDRRPQSPGENGIFQFDPDTGALRIHVFMKDIWDVNEIKQMVRLPNGQFLAFYAGPRPGRQRLYRIDKDETFTKISDIPSKELKAVWDMASSPDGRYVAFLATNRLEVWDLANKKLILDWRQEHRIPRACRFTGEGNFVVSSVQTNIKDPATSSLTGGYINNTSRIDMLEIPSLRVLGELNLGDFDLPNTAFAFSPNGKRMVLSDWKQVAVIDVGRAFPSK